MVKQEKQLRQCTQPGLILHKVALWRGTNIRLAWPHGREKAVTLAERTMRGGRQ